MKLSDVKDRLIPLLEDAQWAEEALEKEDNQFTRRAYIRSLFAMIEGSVWALKQIILQVPTREGQVKKLSVAEYALLSDKTYELKSNGKPKEQTKFFKLPDNFRFTFGLVEKYFKADLNIGIGTVAWDNFLEAQVIRNRITHPKTTKEFEISDNELQTCKKTLSWFNELIMSFFNSLISNATVDNA